MHWPRCAATASSESSQQGPGCLTLDWIVSLARAVLDGPPSLTNSVQGETNMAALTGLLVVDLSRVLAGPFCGQILADMGADVIKVESPGGDENRQWPPLTPNGESSNYASVNRGKRSLTLNLKAAGAADVLKRLARKADVLIHSFLPDTAERLGIRYEDLRATNPKLVFCTISGYGEFGPLRNKPGYDLMVQAFSGVMSTTGFEGGPPIRTGVSFIDMTTGLGAYAAIMTALVARHRTGTGTWVRTSLLETAVSLLGYHAVSWLQGGILPRREGSGVWHLVPYQAFRCLDGYMLAGATNDAAWQRFCEAIERPELARDDRFRGNENRARNRDQLIPMLEERFASDTVARWTARLEAKNVAVAPLQTLDQVLTHPQVLANNMVQMARMPDGSETRLLGTPFKLAEGGGIGTQAPPVLGANTNDILRDVLGYSDDVIHSLHVDGAV
jgi:crotonobetainyl-CoA:carnitine CoA-transferase CaiB-like acyl-CoA transferase